MGQGLRVFVVDDDVDAADSLSEVLELEGHRVTTAYSGEEAIEIFTREDFDLTFMDIMMPGRNGVESFIEIRKLKPEAKVYLMTGFSVQELLDQAIEEGVTGVLHKPVAVDDILHKIDNFIESDSDGQFLLIAHENKAFCQSLVEGLAERNLSAHMAHNGEEALFTLEKETVDILILSLHLPIISGFEIICEMKKRGWNVPTIIIGEEQPKDDNPSKYRDLGYTGVVFKPYDPSAVLSFLDDMIVNGA